MHDAGPADAYAAVMAEDVPVTAAKRPIERVSTGARWGFIEIYFQALQPGRKAVTCEASASFIPGAARP
jgi:hypothetical protein